MCVAPAGDVGLRARVDVRRREARQCARLDDEVSREAGDGARQLVRDDGRETFLDTRHQFFTRKLRQIGQPFGTARQHAGNQPFQAHPVVVEPAQDAIEVAPAGVIRLGIAQGFARRQHVEIRRVVGDSAPEAIARGDGQRIGQVAVEGIDGLDAQPRRAVIDAPAAPQGVIAGRRGELERERVRG